jgi:hypothetical protein
MVTIDNELEIIALGKLLNFIKFDCSDNDCLLFASSPIVNSIYANVLKELNVIYTRKGRPSFENDDYIESYPIYLESIKKNIFRTSNWEDLSDDIKEKYVQELLKPYKSTQTTLLSLINEGNQHNI